MTDRSSTLFVTFFETDTYEHARIAPSCSVVLGTRWEQGPSCRGLVIRCWIPSALYRVLTSAPVALLARFLFCYSMTRVCLRGVAPDELSLSQPKTVKTNAVQKTPTNKMSNKEGPLRSTYSENKKFGSRCTEISVERVYPFPRQETQPGSAFPDS